jgi:hypothetical protein
MFGSLHEFFSRFATPVLRTLITYDKTLDYYVDIEKEAVVKQRQANVDSVMAKVSVSQSRRLTLLPSHHTAPSHHPTPSDCTAALPAAPPSLHIAGLLDVRGLAEVAQVLPRPR